MSDFITLTCPNCSGRLQITGDVNRFVCMYGGVEHIVRRGGGIITLQPVVDELKKVNTGITGVKVGVDRTASELAIQRLQGELAELLHQKRQFEAELVADQERRVQRSGYQLFVTSLIYLVLVVIGLAASSGDLSEIGLLLVCGFLPLLAVGITRLLFSAFAGKDSNKALITEQLNWIDTELARAQQELSRHKQLVRQIDN